MRKQYKRVSTLTIKKIRELSADHTARQIRKITGLSQQMIYMIQNNPKNGIVNPKRIITPRAKVVKVEPEEYFDIEAYSRKYIY